MGISETPAGLQKQIEKVSPYRLPTECNLGEMNSYKLCSRLMKRSIHSFHVPVVLNHQAFRYVSDARCNLSLFFELVNNAAHRAHPHILAVVDTHKNNGYYGGRGITVSLPSGTPTSAWFGSFPSHCGTYVELLYNAYGTISEWHFASHLGCYVI